MGNDFIGLTNAKNTKVILSKPVIREEKKLDLTLLRKRGNSKTYKGLLIQKMKEARDNKNWDVCQLIEWCYKRYLEFEKDFSKQLPEIEIEGLWKGKGTIDINQKLFSEDIIIKIPMKDKKTLEVKWSKKTIPKENVNRILCQINKWKIGEPHECYEFTDCLGVNNWEDIWKKRTKIYFLQYYFPLKILESMKVIEYGGRGEVTRVR
jgi:hypothetical protein